ncbi:unnamed protein product [Clonostachys rosea f. rosea IK726]|uniref:Uncharacterized protein n=1 Tax=Clonostachys rosea f. rosea IK726 TaxID=1349383 RepID=A0ACA9UPL1_BIOOC|nr:unnamed protein product [Clonostachys rosea f. rosea IK726]
MPKKSYQTNNNSRKASVSKRSASMMTNASGAEHLAAEERLLAEYRAQRAKAEAEKAEAAAAISLGEKKEWEKEGEKKDDDDDEYVVVCFFFLLSS